MRRGRHSRTVRRGGRYRSVGEQAQWNGLQPLEARLFMSASEPTAFDQYMIELINRARMDPAAEAARFGIDLNEGINPPTLTSDPREPLAINLFATSAAQLHTADLLANFSNLPPNHVGSNGLDPTGRVALAAGMSVGGVAENNAFVRHSGPLSKAVVDRLHELLFKDFTSNFEVIGRGHRKVMLNSTRNEAGAGVLNGSFGGRNSSIGTIDFFTSSTNYITGVAFADFVLTDNFYTPGEGLGGVTIVATPVGGGASFMTTTWGSGGYSLAVPDGTYNVVASGGSLASSIEISSVTIAGENEKVDFVTGPPPGDLSGAIVAALPPSVVEGSTNDTIGDGDDVLVSTLTNQAVNLVSGASKAYNAQILPGALPAGTHRFFARIDATDAVMEADENNNTTALSAASVVVAPAFQDLGVTAVTTTLFDTIVPGDKGKVSVTLVNNGNVPVVGTVPILVEFVEEGDGTQIITFDANVSLQPGQSKTYSANVTVDGNIPEDEYDLRATISPAAPIADNNAGNNSLLDARNYDLVYGFGLLDDRAKPATFSFMQDGKLVKLSLSGPGSGTVMFNGGDATLVLDDTTLASSVKISVTGGFVTFQDIIVNGSLKQFPGKLVDLGGSFTVTEHAARIDLHDVADDHAIMIQGDADPALSLTLTMNNVQDLIIDSTIGIKSLAVNSWLNTDAEQDAVNAPWIGKLTSKGDFEASLNLSDATVASTLGSLQIPGTVRDLVINSAGNIGKLSFGQMVNTRIYAGIGPIGGVLPTVVDDFVQQATIASIAVTGLKSDPAAAGFINSSIAGWNITKLSLTRVQTDNSGTPFGIAADFIKSLSVGVLGGGTLKASNVGDQATFDSIAASVNLGDAQVRLF